MYSRALHILVTLIIFPLYLFSQCGPATPTFSVNLTGNPNGTWTSPSIVRNDVCCGQSGVNCIKFIVRIDPNAAGVIFGIASGPGAASSFYQVGCGPQIAVGSAICLSGVGPHIITFCKPGNNANTFSITSVPTDVAGVDITVNNGCIKNINANGLTPASVTWNSIFPGASGAYNNYLSCTSGCLTPTITPIGPPPPYIDYVVCGQPTALCNFSAICDTVRITFNPTLGVAITPTNPTICFGQTSTSITAIGSGGSPPYSYLWNNVNPSQTINVGIGNYNVQLSDASGCPPVFGAITVTGFTVAISSKAGSDQIKCNQTPIATLNGTVTGASSGIWSGGTGTYSPNNATLSNLNYSPTAAELASGSVNLFLTTTGNGSCPSKQDTVKITYVGFTGVVTPSITNVSCFGGSNGSSTMNISGGFTPYTYLWNTAPSQTTATASSLSIGIYSVTIKDGLGCTYPATVNIAQPPILTINASISNVRCFGTSSGSIALTPTGGTTPYSYTWSPGGQTTSSVTGLPIGNYSVTVKDANNCIQTATYTVTQPSTISITYTQTNVSCFNGSNGTANTTITGGTSPYTFSWSPGGATSQNVTGLPAGTHTITVTDNLGCIKTGTVAITQPVVLVASATATNETCNYLNNGSATASQTGGTSGYTYLWQPGGQTTATISNQASGSYTVTVTDAKGCTSTAIATITEPVVLTVSFINQINVSCFGGSNASVVASPSGGTTNYTYVWSPGGTNIATISNIPIGTYTVTVSDSKSCVATNTVVITQPTDIATTSTITNVSCNGGSNGTIALTPSGGVSPYTYLWASGGQTTFSVSGLAVGIHTVTVKDANNCPKTYTYTVTQPSTISITYTQTNVSCFNGSDGTVTTTITGGTSPYTFSWSPGGATSQNVTGLPAGTHTITVTDNLGCIKTGTVAITQPVVLVASATATNETCNYLNNGSATASQTGGTSGYTYLWQPGGQTTATISNQASGSYTVTVTDAKGCTSTAIATITEPTVLTVSFINQINVSCFGGSNASVGASPSGGTTNYTYVWSPGGTTNATISNIPIGTYTVTVSDSKSCVATNTVVITQPTDIATTSTITNVSCNGGSNGTIALTPTGGVSPYTYLWVLGGQTTFSVSGLAVGNHIVTVKDANNCQKTYTYTVTQPSTISITYTQTNVSCFNGSDGTANTTITGGTSPYTFNWNPGGATSQNVTGLQAGTHTITVTDNLGCIKTGTVAITQPTVLVASATATNETCNYLNNGSATASQTGGTGGYTYLWQPGGQTTATISNQASGSYTVTVTDAKGCTSTAIATITEPVVLTVSFINQINVSCFGGSNASIGASPSGGTTNYTYVWSPGGTTNATISNIPIGTYTVTVSDSKSCVATNTVVITQPTDIVTTSTITNVSCSGGSNGTIALTPSGGVSPYTYLWASGGQTTFSVSGLAVGIHTVTVKDANNCPKTYTYTVTQPSTISITYTQTNVSCFNGSDGTANTIITGGTSPYTFSWSPSGATSQNVTGLQAGTHTITVTDNLGCIKTGTVAITQPTVLVASATATNETCNYLNNGSATASQTGGTAGYTYLWQPSGQTIATISNQASGSYTVTVTDAKGCTSTAIATITEPTVLTVSFINQINVSCFGGSNASVMASPSGGTTNYTYVWSPGGTTNATISNIPIGTYTVTVSDSKSCVATNTVVITQPTDIATTSTITNVSCNGGSNGTIALTPTGGVSPYTYLWVLGGQTTFSVSGLAVGNHIVTVKDANNCQKTYTYTVTQPSTISITYTQTNVSCFNGSDGTVNTTITGGTSPYTFVWSPGGATSQNVTGLQAGTHTITVSDNLGCIKTGTVAITQPTVLVASATATNETCNYLNNGSATASQTGGTAGYTYLWQPSGQTTSSISNQASGSYTVTVTDAKGCTSTAIATITEPVVLTVSFINQINVSCFGGSNASVVASPSGGTPNYTYTWSPGGTTNATISNIPIGTYTVTVSDSKSCVATNTVVITQPTDIVTTSTITNVSCNGGSNGTIALTPTGGVSPYTYLWASGGQTTFSVSGLAVGNHIVTVKDANNCPKTYTYTVTQPSTISITYTQTNVSCFNGSNGTVNTTITGGTSPYTFSWSPGGATSQNVTGLLAGTHTITVTDNLGCIKTSTVAITQPTVLVASATATNETCNYLNNGSATASQTGGTSGYTYLWQPGGQTTATISNQASGSYTVTVTDSKGCTSTAIATITEPVVLTVSFINQINVSCFGGSNASVVASPSGGTTNYTYTWSPGGATNATISNIPIGTYTVTVSDSKSCVATNTVVITQPTDIVTTSTITNVSCNGGSNGTIALTPTGGVSPYTYLWTLGGQTTFSVSGLAVGIHTVNVKDGNNCQKTYTYTVTQPSTISITYTQTNVSCFNGSDGSVNTTITGGTSPYTFSWSPGGATSQNVTGLQAGTHTITVTDNLGCIKTGPVAITQPVVLVASATATNETCNYLNNGSATASQTGGTSGYTYLWQPGGQTTATISNQASGSYTVTVTDAKGCTSTAIATITEPVVLTVSFINQINVSCFGGSNASVVASPSGGTTNYTYTWSPGGTTNATISNIPIGTYTVTVSDSKSCVATNTVVITQPTDIVTTSTITNVSCNGGSNGTIALTPTGGISPYTYLWASGGQTTFSVSGLAVGIHTVTVKDANNCQKTYTYTVTQPSTISITYTQTNVSCFNGSNGTVNTTITGGTSPYTFSWSPSGATSQNVTGLQAGTHTITVTDNLGCIKTGTVAITQPTVLVATATATNETCNYLNNGSATASQTGGTAGYTYLWQPDGQTTATISNQASGSYTVTVTDAKGCTSTAIATITEPVVLTVSFINQINVSCFGGSNASIGASPSGGTPNYTYTWSPGGTNIATLSNIPIGTYTVTVSDSKSCVATNTVVITQPTDIVTTSTITNVSCNGGSNGTIAVTPTGGVSPYTYLWALGGQTTFSVSGLAVGIHTVTVKDANNCPKTYTYTVTQPSTISITYTQTNVSCFNGSDGTVNTTITGGTSPYTFSWNPGGATSQNVTGLQAGTHTITVTDNLGCIKTGTVAITQPTVLVASATATNETCNYLNNGSATASQTGGTAGYTYLWQPSGQTTSSISNQASGSYTVTVTDAKGCTSTAVATITEPVVLTVSFINQINVSCFGGSNASIGASPSGGTPNYTYSWTPGGATTNALFNISAGTYTISITDNNNCILQNTVAIAQPTAALYVTPTSTATSCFDESDGSAAAQAFEGTSAYTYNWMPGNMSGPSYSNLISGIYTVTATDSKGCTATNTILVNQPPEILPITTSTNSSCGAANGIGSVSVTGGFGPYTYQWIPSGGTGIIEPGLISGSYTVIVTDAKGCTGSQFLDINDSGGPIASIASTTNVTCFGGADGIATASVTGGTGLLTYAWSPSGGNALTANGLTAGTYFITIIDANGCQSIATTPEITEPTQLFSSITTSDVSCFAGTNGSATVTVGGGIPAYSYSWMPGATTGSVVTGLSSGIFTVQIKDAKLCVHTATYAITQPTAALLAAASSVSVSCFGGNNGSVSVNATGGTAPYNYNWMPGSFSGSSISNLTAGTYTSTVTDIKNCTTSTTVTVIEPTPIVLTTGSTNSDCGAANGQATVSATGGMGTYTYSWMPSGGTGTTASGLLAGTYTVEVTDANSCMTSTSQVVADNPGPSVSVVSTTSVSCFGGSDAMATASVTGGSGPFTYSWSPSGGNTITATGLPVGTYTVNITSSNGCLANAISSAIIQPAQLFSSITTSDVSCFAGTNGSATVTVGGGIPAYSYSWMPGATTGSVAAGLSSGIFTVQIKDANLCVHTATYAITQPTAALLAAASSVSVSCFGGNNGSVSVNATGGTAPYNYNWMPGSFSGSSISNLTAGTYTSTVTDIKNCTTSTTVTVIEPTPIVLTTGSTNSDCGAANGQASVSATGGMGTYTYSWMPSGGTATTAIALLAGTYTVQVTDANSCVKTTAQLVLDNPGPSVSVVSTTSVSCFGGSDATATASVTGGSGPFTYSWSPSGGNTITATGIPAGTYTINITSSNGCLASAISSAIIQPTQLFSSITTSDVSCFAGTNGSATVTVGGGIPAYSYSWMPGATTGSVVAGLSSGIFTVQIKDANLCVHTATYAITQPTAALLAAAASNSVSCFGGNNGSVSVNATGGTAPYNYNWMPGSFSGSSISNLTAGTYTSTVTDIKNCTTSTTVTVIEPTPIVLTTGSTNSDCGAANGQASVSATGGMGTYTYSWMPSGGTATTAIALLAGTYTVQVTDANSCVKTTAQLVLDNPGPSVSVVSTTSVSCFGGSDATATASVTGGSGPFTYTWSPSGGNTITATGIPAGTYTINITSSNGCLANAISSAIIQPTQLFSSITTSDVSCFAGTNGSATVTVGGGIPAYSYSWMPSATTGSVVAGLSSGIFTVQIKDANLCVHTATYAITQPTAALLASASSVSVSCFGGNNGAVSVNATGGTAPYNYNWMPMGVNSPSVGGLSVGVYTVNIIDFKNCTTSATVLVTEPTQSLSVTAGGISVSCSGGSDGTATVTATGGTGSYSYSWSPTGGSAQSASGLTPGNYFITVTDANSCKATLPVIISSPTAVTGSLTIINAACGLANGSIISQVTGGTGPYAYSWNPGSVSTSTINALLPGTYTLNVSDAFGCTKKLTTTLINIPGPTLSLITIINDSCFGGGKGLATINISQGNTPYTINWLPYGGTDTTATQLTVGTYTANVIDARGCLSSITAIITEPNPVSISIDTVINVSCFNGNNGYISVTASGGTPSYSYSWSAAGNGSTINNLTAGSYTVNVLDSHFCPSSISMNVSQPTILSSTISIVSSPLCFNGTGSSSVSVSGGTIPYTYTWTTSSPQNGNMATNLADGTYTVSIKDANNCIESNFVTITQPAKIVTIAGLNDTICFNQSGVVTATATGGVGNYYYAWQPSGVINYGTLNINTAIATTNYTVIAYDQNGCAGNTSNVKAIVYSLTHANIQTIGYTPICPGQGTTIYAVESGDTGPLTYSWNNNLGTGPGAFVTIPTQPTTYIVNITNSCGATLVDSVRILFNPPPTILAASNGTFVCVPGSINFSDNSITGNVTDPIISWTWNFGDGTTSSLQNPSHTYTTPGSYLTNVTVTTNGGCTNNNSSSPIIVKAYPYPVAAFSVNSTVLNLPYDVLHCTNQSTGASNYNWNFGDGNTSTAVNPNYLYTTIGVYEIQLIATSPFGCSDTVSVEVITDANVVFPNAFSPNSDGPSGGYYISNNLNNDIFFPFTSGVDEYKLQIFNRWGELIFETEDLKQGWDGYYRGKICQVGVYIWKAKVKLSNGKVFNKVGDVSLIK